MLNKNNNCANLSIWGLRRGVDNSNDNWCHNLLFCSKFKKRQFKKNQLTPINKPSEAVNRSLSFSSNHSIDDQEESLITITISSGRTEQLSSNKAPGRWIQPGEIIKIKHFQTKSGLFYVGGKLTAYQGNSYYNRTETEASLVDDSGFVAQTYH